MNAKVEIDQLFQGIGKYTDFLGYGLVRTEVSPDDTQSAYSITKRYRTIDGFLSVHIDYVDNKFIGYFDISNTLGDNIFRKEFNVLGSVVQASEEIKKILEELPRNDPKALNYESAFLDSFTTSAKYIVSEEYDRLWS